jgi:hypothetical protein
VSWYFDPAVWQLEERLIFDAGARYIGHELMVPEAGDYRVPETTRVEELEGAVRAVCEPFFDRPLKEISLGLVLMRLFQASRRFNVEIQPQLVLLQKTLLNIEGLGRQLDPDLDLWVTAKPILERWMDEQIGAQGLRDRIQQEAVQWAQLLPAIPRLAHRALTVAGARHDDPARDRVRPAGVVPVVGEQDEQQEQRERQRKHPAGFVHQLHRALGQRERCRWRASCAWRAGCRADHGRVADRCPRVS